MKKCRKKQFKKLSTVVFSFFVSGGGSAWCGSGRERGSGSG